MLHAVLAAILTCLSFRCDPEGVGGARERRHPRHRLPCEVRMARGLQSHLQASRPDVTSRSPARSSRASGLGHEEPLVQLHADLLSSTEQKDAACRQPPTSRGVGGARDTGNTRSPCGGVGSASHEHNISSPNHVCIHKHVRTCTPTCRAHAKPHPQASLSRSGRHSSEALQHGMLIMQLWHSLSGRSHGAPRMRRSRLSALLHVQPARACSHQLCGMLPDVMLRHTSVLTGSSTGLGPHGMPLHGSFVFVRLFRHVRWIG